MLVCKGCHKMQPYASFRPASIERTTRKRDAFDAAMRDIAEAGPSVETRLDACRTKKCASCREKIRRRDRDPNTTTGKCRLFWYELRKAPCVDCGRDDGYSEYDHQTDRGEKLHNLGDYYWWAWNGGVEAMRAEAIKCMPRCRNCHQMQPTNTKYKRKYATLDEMPTSTEYEKINKHSRRYMDEKIAFVSARKLQIGACADCDMVVTPLSCHVFAFAHIDARTKVASIAHMCNTRKSLPSSRSALEAEMAKCRLLCAVCHSKETRVRNGA